MTENFVHLTDYVNFCIEQMNSTIDYAKDLDHYDLEDKRRYARQCNDEYLNKALGSISCTKTWMRDETDTSDYNELDRRVFKAWETCNDRIRNEMY